MKKLNLGCADWKLPGWDNIDLPQVDLGVFPWPWVDNSIDEILASHILEHFTRADGKRFLAECWNILRPGGALYIAVPDLDKFIECHLSGDFAPLGGYRWTDLNHLMGGDKSDLRPEWRHKYMYSFDSLSFALLQLDFELITRRGMEEFDNPAYKAISLYMSAIK
jgi:SAM-dependent methyltransferase